MCAFTGGVWTGLKSLYCFFYEYPENFVESEMLLSFNQNFVWANCSLLCFFFSSSLSSSHSSLASEVDDQLGLSGEGLGTAQHDSFSVPLDPQSSAHSQMQLKGSVLLAFKA